MKTATLFILSAAALAMASTASAQDAPAPVKSNDVAPAASEADALWAKVDAEINGIKHPKERPTSREDAMAKFKAGLTALDAASKDFLDKYPNDPRRWKLRMFEGMTAGARTQLALPSKGEPKVVLAEINKATDVDPETKSEASAVSVLIAGQDVENGSLTQAEWKAQADAHLKAFPNDPRNAAIERQINKSKVLAELKTKPVDVKFTAVDGREVDLAKLQGKVVLVDFWATWCGPCVAELPNVLKAYEKLHDKGFEIVGISLDKEKDKLESFTKEKGMTWPQYFDGKGWQNEISTKYGIDSIPAMWLVNKKGIIVSTEARGKLEAEVEKLLAE